MSTKPVGTSAMYSTNRYLEISNLFALVGLGILIKVIFYLQGPASSTIWGYTLSAIALFLLIIIAIAFSETDKLDLPNMINRFWDFALPPFLLLILLCWTIALTISNFSKLQPENGQVFILPSEYNMYSFISSFLIIVQTISLYKFFMDQYNLVYKNKNVKLNQIQVIDNSTITYLLTLLNVVLLGMMQIVLEFFTTDG